MSELSNQIATRQQATGQQVANGPGTVGGLITSMAAEFGKALPATIPPDTFVRLALNELRANPQLAECTQASLLGALMTAARLGLEPGGPLGQFYLTSRNLKVPGTGGRNGPPTQYARQVVPIIGYRGLRDLALRTGRVESVQAFLVRQGDHFKMGSNEERGFWHEWEPADADQDESDRDWVGVLTIARLTGGGKPVWRYMSRKQVMERKKRGSAGDSGPWASDEEAMARKTGIRAIAPDLPSATSLEGRRLAEALRSDEQVQVWRHGQQAPEGAPDARPQELESQEQVDTRTGEVTTPDEQPPYDPNAHPSQAGKTYAPAPDEALPTNATAAQQPTQQRGQRKGKAEQYAPPPEGAPPMDDGIPVEDPPE